ncbi:MAG TPA: hypothetical protein VHC49_06890 [Mycobacteriales bacterium]|nr:hypothetical protein [Mycobacteriales bacterium]
MYAAGSRVDALPERTGRDDIAYVSPITADHRLHRRALSNLGARTSDAERAGTERPAKGT